ncbi:MAG: 3'(2'),5'-bisphosphate nucleotidase [Verrucomicrobiota bacterium]
MNTDTTTELACAVAAVRQAATLCSRVRHGMVENATLTTDDRSPVTVADFGAQAVVLHHLAQAFPDDPVVGEEDADELRQAGHEAVKARVIQEVQAELHALSENDILATIDRGTHTGGAEGRFWTLDPIDGTKGFLRNDQYAIALALIENGKPILGVLGCPQLPLEHQGKELGCLFVAVKGQGAHQYTLGGELIGPISVSNTASAAEACFCESVESGHSRHDWAAEVATRLGITKASVRMDSQCKYGAIARGDADIYLRLPTRPGYEEKIWDHAAGCLVVEEAGGQVTDITGKPLDFSLGRTLQDNRGVVATNGNWHAAVIEAIEQAKA